MRFRFAPSPTGYIHIGNVKTAVSNYVLAKKYNAEFVFRIEDTDKERSTGEYERMLIEDLKWLGLQWDEGPDVGGAYGPYRQSERFDIYKKYTDILLEKRHAYHCYCTQEELDEMRKQASAENRPIVYSGKCRNLSDDEKRKLEAEGRKPSVRFAIEKNATIEINDLIKGKVVFNSENIGGDFIIVRSDGVPVYNYIVVIDDALMKITNVVRGEDHLSNTPKQMLVAKALGFEPPQYAHQGLMLGPDKSKLSKRHGITSLRSYRELGYLPEALLNYLVLIGWSIDTDKEIFSLDEITGELKIENMSSSPAIFDFQKLKWVNGQYIRSYPAEKITDLFLPYINEAGYKTEELDRAWLESLITVLQAKCELLSDIKNLIGIFLEDVPEPDEETIDLLRTDDSAKVITEAKNFITETDSCENFYSDLVNYVKEKAGVKGKNLFMPIRGIITGCLKGPELDAAVPLIGIEKCRKRIQYMYDKFQAGK